MDYLVFERRLLRLIFRSNVPLTPVHVAYYLGLPISEARSHLDSMVSQGILELDSDESGHILYSYPMRPPLAELPEPRPPRRKRKRQQQALIPSPMHARHPTNGAEIMLIEERRFSPAAAAALSFFLPGVGQIYSGRVPQGIGWMLATGLGYLLFLVPGLILHICCVVNAAAVPSRLPALAERVR
jgi:hypothetical protein